MDLTYSTEDEAFRAEVREWLGDHLNGEFASLKGLGGPGREHEAHEERLAWDRHLASHGWTCIGWPKEYDGRGLPLFQQVIFHEEYARAHAPSRVNHFGEELLGPTLIAFGSDEQRARFLPRILAVEELWCQGYSEPGAGSDLANVTTKARLDGDEWIIDGQKIWTSLAQFAQWCFVIARTEQGSSRHAGLSFLLVPMNQPGIDVRPIEQLTGGAEFNEVFFSGARTARDLVVGTPGAGWSVAMGLLGYERGVSTIGQQVGFARELELVVDLAKRNGSYDDPLVRDQIASARMGLDVMRLNALRMLSTTTPGPGDASVSKLVWANWHRSLGELAMRIAGPSGLLVESKDPYRVDQLQSLFLFSRSDTIYGGSNEVQRNIIAERVLGLPKEPKG